MYSRRHPYLFFLLTWTAISGVIIIGVTSLVVFGLGGDEASGEAVGVVEISGIIADARDTLDQIRQFREDDDIKAVLVRINSPGGAVGPAQEIFREIQKTREKKKVIASLGTVAASGGYYIAASTDGIMASPGTVTGSIGVIMSFTDYRELLAKIGLKPMVIKSGAFKDLGSGARAMSDEEKQILEGLTRNIHRQFVRDVAAGRRLEVEAVDRVADGRVFTGEAFMELGFVDRIGNFEDAVEWAGRLGGIEGKVETVNLEDDRFSWLERLAGRALDSVARQWFDAGIHPGFLYRPGAGGGTD